MVLTGAGISTPSGIPDFRSPGSGLWENLDPFDVISLTTFHKNPQVFFDWLYPLAAKLKTAQPNPAHLALSTLEKMGKIQAVLTQNIDGLHQKAGSNEVYELHGTLDSMICPRCAKTYTSQPFWEPFLEKHELPVCVTCSAVLKPEIVFFEEQLPPETWFQAEEYASAANLIIVVGSSLEVVPANSLPLIAIRHGAHLAIINRSSTPMDKFADILIPANIEEVLPLVVDSLQTRIN